MQALIPSSLSASGDRVKNRLLVCDLDHTLFARVSHHPLNEAPAARPWLLPFLQYVLHPDSPWLLGIWTFSGREWGIARCRSLALPLFSDGDMSSPELADGVAFFFGLQDSHRTADERAKHLPPLRRKDLALVFDFLERAGCFDFGWHNTVLVDDVPLNAMMDPMNYIKAPAFEAEDLHEDLYLLALVGALHHLAAARHLMRALAQTVWGDASGNDDLNVAMVDMGKQVLSDLGIKWRGRRHLLGDPKPMHDLLQCLSARGETTAYGPVCESEPPKMDADGLVLNPKGCCQDVHVSPKAPVRDAHGAQLHPTREYENAVAVPSRLLSAPRQALVCFDLDGTLYARPACFHDPYGDPAGRPYLQCFLKWLFRPASPWRVAFWTCSQRSTALNSLSKLQLGLVEPSHHPDDKPVLLSSRLVSLWAREETIPPQDYNVYVRATKDFDHLWTHLRQLDRGEYGPENTVMIDDTPNKLRAQPDTLLNPPTFAFPSSPSKATEACQTDTFLLELAGALEELCLESNMAYSIASRGWNNLDFGSSGERKRLVEKGVKALESAGVRVTPREWGHVLPPPRPSGTPLNGALGVWRSARRHH